MAPILSGDCADVGFAPERPRQIAFWDDDRGRWRAAIVAVENVMEEFDNGPPVLSVLLLDTHEAGADGIAGPLLRRTHLVSNEVTISELTPSPRIQDLIEGIRRQLPAASGVAVTEEMEQGLRTWRGLDARMAHGLRHGPGPASAPADPSDRGL